MIDYFLSPQSVEAVGWTLLHSLWQGAAFAILLALMFIALRSYTAQSRYIVATGLLASFFLTVVATFWLQLQDANSRFEMTAVQTNVQEGDDFLALQSNIENISAQPISSEILSSEHSSHWLTAFSDYYDQHLPLLVTIWLLGVFFLQLRFLGQLAYVQRLKHYGTELFPKSWSDKIEELEGKLRIQKKVSYLTSIRIESPMVIGWLKPAILLPRHLFKSLSETEIYEVLAHELAHIRREDFVVNLMQTLLCNVFFFHPGIWWMSNRVDDEREHCCDDLAVAATGQATSYAKTLINVSELQLKKRGSSPALAMALDGAGKKRERGGFTGRIHRLFMVNNGAGTFREGFATACILFAALFLGIVATGHTVQATDQPSQESSLSKVDETDSINASGAELNDVNEIEPGDSPDIESENINDYNAEYASEKVSKVINESEDNTSIVHNALPIEGGRISNITQPPAISELPVTPFGEIDSRIDVLIRACAEGDIDIVEVLLDLGIDVNDTGTEGFTPLMMAASEDEIEVINYLLLKGANVNQVSRGWTALIEAADEGSLASMEILLKAGADVNYYARPNSPTAITMAASEGNLKCLQLLFRNGADINGIGKSIPPLHIAAEEDKRDIIDFLISQKVNINKKDAIGRTALMYAASEGKKYSVEMLVDAGADISVVDYNGSTAKDYADYEDDYDTRKYLGNVKIPDIHQATLDGLIEKVERMVEEGMDVNTRDDYGRTPLHIASAENHNIDMLVLINLGADINAQDNQDRTPMMYAAADGHGDPVALLVSRQANVNIQDEDGMRAFDWARNSGNSDLTNFLSLITESKKEGDDNAKRRNASNKEREKELEKRQKKRLEKTVEKDVQREVMEKVEKVVQRETVHISENGIHIKQYDLREAIPEMFEAVRNGSIQECQNLLKRGVKVNSRDGTGQTALMVAAMTDRKDMANFLIKNGADVNLRSSSGLTALHYTALENYDKMARLLLDNNAKVDARMRYSSTDGSENNKPRIWEYKGATPLLIAVEAENYEVAVAFIEAGANPNQRLIKNEYEIKKGNDTYLSLSEVFGIDEDFLNNSVLKFSDKEWTPYKQALHMKNSDILALFPK